MIQNLREDQLYELLPDAVITLDERGLLQAVIGGFQDRLEDLRAYSSKLRFFFTVGNLPETGNNAVLADVTSDQGIVFTRSLEIQDDTPAPNATVLLNQWVGQQLNLDSTQYTNVRYGVDMLRQVDVDTLGYLADTLGAILYASPLSTDQTATQQELVTTWFPRLKIKGTVRSFEVLGRILGFDDVKVTPLWARVSPRLPQDIGNPANDPDFAEKSEFPPQQYFGVDYNPLATRDGPFFTWVGTVSNVISDTNYYEAVVNGFSPFVTVDTIGSFNGTVTHPSTGSYSLTGGDAYTRATVQPLGSGVQFDAIVQGDAYNGLAVNVVYSGTGSLAVLSIVDQLSSIKYRSAFYDIGLTADMDKVEEIFGANAVRQNKDLAAGSNTSDGTAVSPFRPWIAGSIVSVAGTHDFLTFTATTNGSTIVSRHEATATDRELNFTELVAAGVAVAQAFEEVRPATRFPRRTDTGFLIDDKVPYAFYGTQALLFISTGSVTYTGTDTSRPLPNYDAIIQVQVSQLIDVYWASIPGAIYFVYWKAQIFDPFVQIATVTATNIIGHFYYATTSPTSFFAVSPPGGGPPGGGGNVFGVLVPGFPINSVAASDPIDPMLWHYRASSPNTNLLLTGSYDFAAGTYYFNIVPDSGGNGVWAYYTLTSTEVVRGEPPFVTKYLGEVNALDRPEDDWYGTHTDNELADEYPWRRDIVGGGELVEVDTYLPYTPDLAVTPVSAECVFQDQTGAEYSIRAVKTTVGMPHMRYNVEARSTTTYVPGMLPIGYVGTFKDLAALTPTQVSDLNTFTDAETLFNPGFALYHTGLAAGVLVADLPKFFGPQHRNSLVGWLPFNEHAEEPVQVLDHSPVDGTQYVQGVDPNDRVWDDMMGWVLSLEPGGIVSSGDIRAWGATQTVSFWFNAAAGAGVQTLLTSGNISFDYNAGTTTVLGYCTVNGTRVLIGSAMTSGWSFVYVRRSATQAVFGCGFTNTPATETTVLNTFDAEQDGAQVVFDGGPVTVEFHDLRVWSIQKLQADMELVRYHNPTPTVVNYPIGFMMSASEGDRFGLRVLASGWVTTDVMPAWVRRPAMAWVRRYDDLGAYTGEHRFSETGLGDGPALPALYQLGCQYRTITAVGTTVASTGTGQLPGVNDLWLNDTTAGTYLSVTSGVSSLVAYGSGSNPWPADMVQTNPNREFIWITGSHGGIYEVTAEGTSPATLNPVGLVPKRMDSEILVNPVYASLFSTGTYWTFTSSHSISGTLVNNIGTITIADLGVAQIQVTPAFIDFGSVAVNATAFGTFTVKNVGDAAVSIIGAASLTNTAGSNGFFMTAGTTYSLPAGASSTTVVEFAPTVGNTTYVAALAFSGDGGATTMVTGASAIPGPDWNNAEVTSGDIWFIRQGNFDGTFPPFFAASISGTNTFNLNGTLLLGPVNGPFNAAIADATYNLVNNYTGPSANVHFFGSIVAGSTGLQGLAFILNAGADGIPVSSPGQGGVIQIPTGNFDVTFTLPAVSNDYIQLTLQATIQSMPGGQSGSVIFNLNFQNIP